MTTSCSCPTCKRMDREDYALTALEKRMTIQANIDRPHVTIAKSVEMQERERQEERMMIENALRTAARNAESYGHVVPREK
jgi:hypothetical protein